MGCKEKNSEVLAFVDECLKEVKGKLSYKVCFDSFEINCNAREKTVDLGFCLCKSEKLAANLKDCSNAVVFAATIGIEIDRLIAKYGRISPSKALCFQAIGAERIEALCNTFNDEITQDCQDKGLFTRARYSPGYGDLSLNFQKNIFSVLDCPRKIGLSLNESLIMSPSKSVTAIIGISDKPKPSDNSCTKHSCNNCSKTDCSFRRK